MTFIFGIILSAVIFFFFDDIQSVLVTSGLRDSLVIWLQSWK
ncbi:MAG: hypothetical protein O3A39_10150 [Proteobacteria bacterium]|jgi:hypothetical protein|nr:hypothetical protein [Pseudomonadota bacterium]MDA1135625.1 hypothetical protein [Pseudomonadota bacterium]